MQRAAVTDSTGTEGPKNAWSRARATDPAAAATAAAYPHLTLLVSHGAPGLGDDTFKDGPSASDGLQTTLKEHDRALALWALDWPGRGLAALKQTQSGQPHPNLSKQHGHGEHLRAEHLRAGQEKEEPWSHGSD